MIDSLLLSRRLAPLLALVAACSSPDSSTRTASGGEGEPEKSAQERLLAPLPWTEAFQKPAVLIATDVRIEGPKGLLRHVATISDAEELNRVEKTIPEGFLQDIVVKPDAVGAEIRAQLDQLAIVATRRLTVLERPGPVDVVVLASGDAYWARGKEPEKRGDSLRLDGKIVR